MKKKFNGGYTFHKIYKKKNDLFFELWETASTAFFKQSFKTVTKSFLVTTVAFKKNSYSVGGTLLMCSFPKWCGEC